MKYGTKGRTVAAVLCHNFGQMARKNVLSALWEYSMVSDKLVLVGSERSHKIPVRIELIPAKQDVTL